MADGEQNPEDVDAGLESNQALIAAREHLASVSEELASIQRQFDQNCAGFALPGVGIGTAARAGDSMDARALEVQLRHLEVDRDEANLRADRLAREKEELLAVQANLEAELRATRRSLDETRRLLRHRELDLQQHRGHAPAGEKPPAEQQPAMLMDVPPPKEEPPPKDPLGPQQLSKTDTWSMASTTGGRGKDSWRSFSSMNKPQAIASLRAVQAELREEQGRHEKLERRMRKDRERMEGLVALAERQRGEIGLLRRRGDLFEAYAGECERKLRQGMAHMDGSGAHTAASSEHPGNSQPLTPVGGIGGAGHAGPGSRGAVAAGSPGMVRQKSAPTRLPNVVRRGHT